MEYYPSIEEIKHRRDVFLAASDIFCLADRWNTYTNKEKQLWATFRQQLRDLPNQPKYPNKIVWPVAPRDLGIEKPDPWPSDWP